MSRFEHFQRRLAREYVEVGLLYRKKGPKAAAEYVNEVVKPLVDEESEGEDEIDCTD